MSTKAPKASIPKEEPDDEPDDVLFNTIYGVRTIELNRPKKLNSLNGSMARKIIPRLKEWEKSQLASVIIMAGAGEKAFCAGGDVAALAQYNQQGTSGIERSKAYFELEYQLDHLIATYPKPYIAYMDGITMGGGVGLSVHAPIRIATERTLFAMPETTIGFFPDVGGSFFLPRLDGHIGAYLALTSERLKGVNAYYAGIATHYIDSSSLSNLTARLSELVFKDYADMAERLAIIDTTIAEFGTGLPYNEPMLLAGDLRRAIDRCFCYNSVEQIIEALQQESGETALWAEKTLKTLSERSPTSMKVALRQMELGRTWDISDTFRRENHIASKFMEHPDFVSGVSAKLINKPPTTPKWEPPSLEQISREEVDAFFNVEGTMPLPLHGIAPAWREYPFGFLGLPREGEVRRVVMEGGKSAEGVVATFLTMKGGKPGVREKVEEVLERKCEIGAREEVMWIEDEKRR
ncbi:hypothetical protein MMC34_002265 [Xylographa carneopallida]|nr:hypothetical protein [Xylographa carneopallida]